MNKNLLSNLLLILFSLVFTVGLLEVACRFVILSNDTDPTYKLKHETLPYTMKPNSVSTSIHGHEIRINSLGLRDHEYNYEKPDGVFRILVLGDSSTFSYGNSMDDGFTKVLERSLNSKSLNSKKVEVINTGHPGYNTRDEYNYLKLYGLKYNPDIIVVATMTNDFTSDGLNLAIKDGVDSKPGSFWLKIPSWVKRTLRQSRLYVALRWIQINNGLKITQHKVQKISDESLNKMTVRSMAALTDLTQLATQNQLPIYFISIPNRYETMTKTYIAPIFYEQIKELSSQQNVHFIDMLNTFSEYADDTDRIFAIKDSSHPNAEGHKLLATKLEEKLKSLLVKHD